VSRHGQAAKVRALLRVGVRIAAGLLLVVAVLVFALALYLHAPWGGGTLASILQERISAGIAGELRIGRVVPVGPLHLRFEEVAFVDPDGRLAIAVDVVELQLRALALLEPRLDVDTLLLQGTRVEVATSEGGIGKVFGRRGGPAPPAPSPDEEEGPIPPPPPLPIRLRSIRIEGGSFRLVPQPGSPASLSLVRGLDAEGDGAWEHGLARIDLAIRGELVHPLRRPLEVEARGSLLAGWLRAEPVVVRIGATTLAIGGGAALQKDEHAIVAAVEGTVDPAEASYVGIQLAQPVRILASLGRGPAAWLAAIRASAQGGGDLDLAGSLRDRAVDLRLDARRIDPARWMRDAPQGSLGGRAEVGGSLQPLDLDLRLGLESGELAGERLGPGELVANLGAPSGALEARLERVALELEGASLRARGLLASEGSDLQADVQVGSLALLRPVLERLAGTSLQGLQGEGEIRAALQGELAAPTVSLEAKIKTFALGEVRANSIDLRVSGGLGPDGLPVGRLLGSFESFAWEEHRLAASRIEAARASNGDFHLQIEPAPEADRGRGAREKLGRLRLDTKGRGLPENFELDRFEGSFRGEGLDLALEGRTAVGRGRASGAFDAAAGGIGLVRVRFDLPLDPAAAAASSPILLHVIAAPLDLVGLSPFVGVDLPVVRLRGALDLRGPIGAPDLQGEAQLSGLEVPGQPQLPPLDARLHGGIRGRNLEAGLELWDGEARIAEVAASGPMETGRLRRDPAGALSRLLASERSRIVGTVVGLDLAHLGAALDLPELQGSAAAALDLRGPIRDPRGTLQAELRGGPAGPLPIVHAKASAELFAEEVRLRATLHLPVPPQGEATPRTLPGQGRGGAAAEDPTRDGEEGSAEDSIDRLDRLADEHPEKVARQGKEEEAGGGVGRADVAASGATGQALGAPLEVDLRLGASPAKLLGGRLDPSTAIELRVDLDAFDLASIATGTGRKLVTRVDESARGRRSRRRGRVIRMGDARGRLLDQTGSEEGRRGPSEELEPEHLLQGLISLGAGLRGTLGAPRGEAHLHARSLGWEGVALGDAELRLELEDAGLEGRLHIIDAALGSFAATLQLGPGFSPLAIVERGVKTLLPVPLLLRMEADQLSIAPLGAVLGGNRTSGRLSLELEADGRIAELKPVGTLRLEEATFELAGGLLYQGIELHLRLEEERLELVRLEGRAAGGGSFVVSGELGAPGARPFETLLAVISEEERGTPTPFHAGLRTRQLPVGGPGGIAAELSLEGGLEGTLDPVRGLLSTLTLESALVELPARSPRDLQVVARPDDIVIVSGPKAAGPSGGPTGERRRLFPLELRLRIPRSLRIESPDVELEARVDLLVRRGRDGEAVGDGTVSTTRGTVTALGRPFDLERAVVRWLGDPIPNPHLEITARYDARQALAWADVGGTARSPTISLRSDPPLPESQIVSLILSGRTQNPGLVPVENAPLASGGPSARPGAGAGTGGSVSATSVIGAAVTQKLGQALGPRVPVSVLASESAAGQPLVEAGTFIFGRLYLGFVRNFLPEPGENANEVRAEYELSRTVGIETRFGDAAAGGVDVVWQKSFETPQQQRARKAAALEARKRREQEQAAQERGAAGPPAPEEGDGETQEGGESQEGGETQQGGERREGEAS